MCLLYLNQLLNVHSNTHMQLCRWRDAILLTCANEIARLGIIDVEGKTRTHYDVAPMDSCSSSSSSSSSSILINLHNDRVIVPLSGPPLADSHFNVDSIINPVRIR